MIHSFSRGWEITYENNQWVWLDTREPIKENERPCKRCGCLPTKDGHDACIGKLKNVESACCGHGVEEPYVVKGK